MVTSMPARSRGRRLAVLATMFRPRALFRYLRDPKTKVFPKLLLLAATIYLVLPLDFFPDLAPFIGWLDDVGLVTAALAYLSAKVVEHERESGTTPGTTPRPELPSASSR